MNSDWSTNALGQILHFTDVAMYGPLLSPVNITFDSDA